MSFALGLLPIILLVLGFPIFVVLLTSVTVALVFFMNLPFAALHQTMYGAIDAFALLAVPFFLYAGEIMGRGSIARRLVDPMQAAMSRLPGSLGVTSVATSTFFGAISGASTATVATASRIRENQFKANHPIRSCRTPAKKLAVAVVPNTRKSFRACVLPRSDGR